MVALANTKPTPVKQQSGYANPVLRRRRAIAITLGATLVVGGVATFTATMYPGFARTDHVTVAAPVFTTPPNLALTALPRIGEQTDLVAALPDTVYYWVQTGISGYLGWQHTNEAVEAWNVTYRDGRPASTDPLTPPLEVLMTVGQWSTSAAASAFLRATLADFSDPLATGEVSVGVSTVGSYYLYGPDALSGSDLGTMWWRNGTVVVKITGPISELADFYSAFPL
ncbi:MAG: hypothetical protein FWG25_07590 [Promicromonosporaceae bacterium]|nr:hypothetical protein [Promicromonosporaceae bacterium]